MDKKKKDYVYGQIDKAETTWYCVVGGGGVFGFHFGSK